MNHRTSKRIEHIRQVAVYILMACTVFVIVTFITLFMLGFRFDAGKGGLEQYAFLQFASSPSGATVSIDGQLVGSKTPNKSSVPPGKHVIEMWRDGYETWSKTVDVKAGTLTWLNYTLLVPKKLTVESVLNYDTVSGSLASPNGNSILVQKKADIPTFELINLSSDTVKSSTITIPKTVITDFSTTGIVHSYKAEKWDSGGRYVLVKHGYGAKSEWLVMDTQNVASSKNISKTFDVAIDSIVFSDTSGNMFYALETNDIRKLDLSAGTMSRPLISNVTSFEIYEKSRVITYVGFGASGTDQRVVGIYREGDDGPSVIRTVSGDSSIPLNISTTNYFNENYIAISEGKKVDVLSGSYPNTTTDNANTMKVVASFSVQQNITKLSFSQIGEFVLAQAGPDFASYDLEYAKLYVSSVAGSGETYNLKWLDENHLWSDRDGKLTIREFNGSEVHTINPVIIGQDSTLTNNGRYIYSINSAKTGFQLQRVRMILP